MGQRITATLTHPQSISVCSGGCAPERYGYEPNFGALDTLVDVRGFVQSFSYDLTARLSQRRSPGNVTDTFTYNPDDNLTQHVVTGNSQYLSSAMAYDRRGKVVHATANGYGGTAELWLGYTGLGAVNGQEQQGSFPAFGYEEFTNDALGQRLVRRQLGGAAPLGDPERKRTFTYDAKARLTRIEASPPPPPFTYEHFQDFAYDPAGNTTLVHSLTRGEDEDGNPALAPRIPQVQFASFADETQSEVIHHDSHISYYGGDNKLRVFNRHVGVAQFSHDSMPGARGIFEEYRYDALGRRVLTRSRRIGVGCPASSIDCQSSEVRTIWDGERILYQIRAPGGQAVISDSTGDTLYTLRRQRYTAQLQYASVRSEFVPQSVDDTIPDPRMEQDLEIVSYTHAPGVGGVDNPIAVHKIGVETVFPHENWRGMLALGTGTDGRQTDCGVVGSDPCVPIDWPARDATVDRASASRPEPLSWFGTLASSYAEQSGMQYRRNRYYDAKRGQFTQADPIGLAGGLNVYGFAEGDPVNFDDPFGLCPWCIGAGIGAAAGAGYTLVDNYLNDRPLSTNLIRNTLVGAIGGATLGRGIGLLAGTGAATTAATGRTLFEGGRQGLRTALGEGITGLSRGQGVNIARQLGKGAVENIKITAGSGGVVTAEFTRSGRNGYQTLTKVINAAGETVRMVQTAYDRAGKLVHGEAWK